MRRHLRSWIGLFDIALCGLATLSCSVAGPRGMVQEDPSAREATEGGETFTQIAEGPTRKLTSGRLAVSNLNAQIAGLARLQESGGTTDAATDLYIELLLSRVQFLGTFDDFEVVSAVIARLDEEERRGILFRARLAVALHEFGKGEELLSALSPADPEVAAVLSTIDLALYRDLAAQVELKRSAADRYPSYGSFLGLALILAAEGSFEEADEYFALADDAYTDVSPFPLAWSAFQRGVMWAEQAGESEIGAAHYRRAVTILPQYVVANVHLSESVGLSEEREELLLRVAGGGDPEPDGKLAQLYADVRPELARDFLERAATRYGSLLGQYEFAFLDHASEFLAGPGGDPDGAVRLAITNLEVRQTPRSYLVALRARRAQLLSREARGLNSEDCERALCDLAAEARRQNFVHPVLDEELEIIEENCIHSALR